MQKAKNKSKTKTSYNKVNKSEGIFDYDLETSSYSVKKTEKKLTKKAKKAPEPQIDDIGKNVPKVIKEKMKERQKRKKKEKREAQKKVEQEEKIYAKVQKQKVKRKLTNEQIKKQKKRIRRIQNLTVFALFIVGIILLMLSPIFNIREIVITGNEKVSQAMVLSLLAIDEETNIFRETNKDINEKIKQNPYVSSIIIKRELPSKLKIQIKERTIDYFIKVGEAYAYINKEGYILEVVGEKIEGKIELQGYETSIEHIIAGNKVCDDDLGKIEEIEIIIDALTNAGLGNLITSINIQDEDDYIINMESESKTIYIGNYSNLDVKILYIKTILEKENGNAGKIYVNRDLNVQKPYFSPNI